MSFALPTFDGDNYQMWSIRMQAYLEAGDLWDAVEEEYVVPPLQANPTVAQIKLNREHRQRKSKAKASLFAAVSPSIFTRIMSLNSAHEVWKFLKAEYEGNVRIKGMRVINLMRDFELQKMKETETTKEYLDRLLIIINQIKLLGHNFEDSRLIQKILVTLPERYEAAISSLENSKDLTQITLPELVNALQATEQRRAMRAEGGIEGALQARALSNQKYKGKKKYTQGSSGSGKTKDEAHRTYPPCHHCGKAGHPPHRCWRRPDVKCNKCHQQGHIARFCRSKEQNDKAVEAQVSEEIEEHLFVAMAAVEDSETWLVDSGCTNHMTNIKEILTHLEQTGDCKVKVGNGQFITGKGRGIMSVETNSGIRTIKNVLYVPEISCNLISVGQLLEEEYEVIFKHKVCTIIDSCNRELFRITMNKRSFVMKLKSVVEEKAMISLTTEELWHRRTGHIHHDGLLNLRKLAEGIPGLSSTLPDCKTCHLGKQHRIPFQDSNWRAVTKLQLIHTDLAGPFPEQSLNGSRYYILLVDDKTRMSWIYFLKFKSEALDTFKQFKTWIENQSNHKIKILRSDNGSEYTSSDFNKLCLESGIEHQLTAPYTPQQNGVCERRNRTVVEMTRCLMMEKDLPKRFWAEASNTAVFLINRLPTKAIENMTPFECWYGFKPNLSSLKIFGCVCYVHIPEAKRDKLDRKAEIGVFVGYSSVSKAYRVYLPETMKISISRDVSFEENLKWNWAKLQIDQPGKLIDQTTKADDNVDEAPVRGTRSLAEIYDRCSMAVNDPVCYKDASNSPEWVKAMEEELQAIDRNQTWQLVSRPEHRKVIGVKWTFRTKMNPDGTTNKLKARLVVKGYAQKRGVDFEDTFAPVTRFDTVRLLLALAAQKVWNVHHLDIKSAFLNGYLEEEIFVEQPEGFKVAGEENKVYLLKKALYGLKQAPRAWNSRIDQYLIELGYKRSQSEPALYIKRLNQSITIISLYVDDFLITGSSEDSIEEFKRRMQVEFEMTDLGRMTYFLGMEIVQTQDMIFLHQQKYATDILKKFTMFNCKPVTTPAAMKQKLRNGENSTTDLTVEYRSLVGRLMYLTNTRPDITQAVGVLTRYLHCAEDEHMQAAKRVLRYLKGSLSYGLKFTKSYGLKLLSFTDSDWAGSWDMKSTSGACYSIGSGIFSWSSKKQTTVAQSTAEAELIAATSAANQVIWLRKILNDLGEEQNQATKVFVDNQSTIAIADNPVFHGKTKHFNIKLYFLRDAQKEGSIKLNYCKSKNQIADIFTKPLTTIRFEELRTKLGMVELDSRRNVEEL